MVSDYLYLTFNNTCPFLPLICFNTQSSHAKLHVDFRLHENSPYLRKVIFYTGGSPESEWTDYTLEWLRQLRDNHAVFNRTCREHARTHMHADKRTHVSSNVCDFVAVTDVAVQTCVGQSPILSGYVNVHGGWKRIRESDAGGWRGTVNKRNGRR